MLLAAAELTCGARRGRFFNIRRLAEAGAIFVLLPNCGQRTIVLDAENRLEANGKLREAQGAVSKSVGWTGDAGFTEPRADWIS